MNSLKTLFYKGYALPLLFFIWAIVDFWSSKMNQARIDASQTRYLAYSTYFLIIYSIFVITQRGIRQNSIHLVCILWWMIMPFVVFFSHGKLLDYAQTLLWPILFEAAWAIIKNRRNNIYLLQKVLYFAFAYGLMVFLLSDRHTEGQTNTIYFPLLTLPWILFGKNRRIQMIIIVIFTVLAIYSLKRSAMMSIAGVWLVFLLTYIKGKKTLRLLLVLILILPFYGIILDYADRETEGALMERVNREETDEGTNRLAIYEVTMAMIGASDPTELITGHGHYAVYNDSILEKSAHNDMLEVIYDYGVIIFALYLCLWIFVIRRSIQLYRIGSELFLPYASSVIIFVIMSSVGHLILYTSYFNYIVLFWGGTEVLLSFELFRKNEGVIYYKGISIRK